MIDLSATGYPLAPREEVRPRTLHRWARDPQTAV